MPADPIRDALKPCPFCGGPVWLEQTESYYDDIYGRRKWWGVVCRNTENNRGGTCAVSIRPSASEDAAIARWNNRALAQGAETPSVPVAWLWTDANHVQAFTSKPPPSMLRDKRCQPLYVGSAAIVDAGVKS